MNENKKKQIRINDCKKHKLLKKEAVDRDISLTKLIEEIIDSYFENKNINNK